MLKSYKKAKKPRHIVNGRAFETGELAASHIETSGLELERIETILKITIYHTKPSTK